MPNTRNPKGCRRLSDEERPTGGGLRDHFIWSPEEISGLIAAADGLGQQPQARYNYAPLIELLVLGGPRIGEALATQVQDVDLLGAELHVRHSGGRKGAELSDPKTEAGKRTIPLAPGLVDLFARIIPADAAPDDFVFHAKGNDDGPPRIGAAVITASLRRAFAREAPETDQSTLRKSLLPPDRSQGLEDTSDRLK